MPCQKFCSSRKDGPIEDSEWLALSLRMFLRVHHLLTNFSDFFRYRVSKCCYIDHKFPLHGALDVVAMAMKLERPGLFCEIFLCAQRLKYSNIQRPEPEDVPSSTVYKVNAIVNKLQKYSVIEDMMRDVKEVVCTMENCSSNYTSERLRTLSFLLQEIKKNLICCDQNLMEPLYCKQEKLVWRLIDNFIHTWSEKRSPTAVWVRICKFCDHIISETTRQWGVFCCRDAQVYNNTWEEWALQQSILGASKDAPSDEEIKSKHSGRGPFVDTDGDYPGMLATEAKRSQVQATLEASWTRRVTDYDSSDALSVDEDKNARGIDASSRKPGNSGPTIKRPSARDVSATRRAGPEVSSRKTEPESYGSPSRGPDKFDGVEDRDLTKTTERRFGGKTREGPRSRRDIGSPIAIDTDFEYPIASDRQVKRDDVPPRNQLDGIRDEEEAAAGKMRKIRRAAGDSYRDRRERDGVSRTDTDESGVTRSRRERGDPSVKKKYGRHRKSGDDEERKIDRSETEDFSRQEKKSDRSRAKKIRNVESSHEAPRKGNKLHRDTMKMEERVTKMNDTEDEEEKTGQRGGKKSRNAKHDETEDSVDRTESKETRGRRKKNPDAFDSGNKGVSSHGLDEEGTALKRDGKRRDRSSEEREGTDSDLMRKRKGGKVHGTSTADKSTLDSEGRGKKKGRILPDSSRTDDDYGKINDSRYRERKPRTMRLYDVETDHRSSIEYQLSDQHFVKEGWTVLPIAKTMRKIVQYEARPAKPHLNWFEKHKNDGRIYYNNGSAVFVNFHTDGSGEVFYPNGKLAIEVCRPENRKYDMCTVFTPGGKDCVGVERKSQIVAVFDTMGNGAVFNEDGATRLSYNQIGGIWRDNPAGAPLMWTWDSKKESIVKIVYAEKPAAHLEKLLSPALRTTTKSSRSIKALTSLPSSRNKEKKVVEQEPVVAAYDEEEEVESGGNFYDYPKETCFLKAICTKLTDCVSLKILNRRNISLHFLANAKRIRLELGTVLNLNKEVASYFVDSSSKDCITKCKFDKMSFELETHNSLYNLVQELRKVKKSARQRKHMIAKYMPNFPTWQKMKTRCRP